MDPHPREHDAIGGFLRRYQAYVSIFIFPSNAKIEQKSNAFPTKGFWAGIGYGFFTTSRGQQGDDGVIL